MYTSILFWAVTYSLFDHAHTWYIYLSKVTHTCYWALGIRRVLPYFSGIWLREVGCHYVPRLQTCNPSWHGRWTGSLNKYLLCQGLLAVKHYHWATRSLISEYNKVIHNGFIDFYYTLLIWVCQIISIVFLSIEKN